MEVLYHYTSVDGFEGIVKNNRIRMTKSEFLNDPYDCHMFVKLVEKYLDTHKNEVEETISNLNSHNDDVRQLYENKGCNLINYIEFIQKKVGLYVMSLTHESDALNMWNYYGHGGMQLDFSLTELTDSIRSTFDSEKEFLTQSRVIYANMELDIDKIIVPDFSHFVLMNKKSKNIFAEHHSYIKEKSYYQADQLYTTSNLGQFIKSYIKGYVASLEYLLKLGTINTCSDMVTVFEEVFDNISKLNNFYYWKHDLSLYMLVLSALIKSDTYEYENEHRIVYFEYNIKPIKKKTEEYGIKCIDSNRFLYPYITFELQEQLNNSLRKVTISPITNNLTIDSDSYIYTLKQFLNSNKFDRDIDVKYSKHKIRW